VINLSMNKAPSLDQRIDRLTADIARMEAERLEDELTAKKKSLSQGWEIVIRKRQLAVLLKDRAS
jgi:hypothetical protein